MAKLLFIAAFLPAALTAAAQPATRYRVDMVIRDQGRLIARPSLTVRAAEAGAIRVGDDRVRYQVKFTISPGATGQLEVPFEMAINQGDVRKYTERRVTTILSVTPRISGRYYLQRSARADDGDVTVDFRVEPLAV